MNGFRLRLRCFLPAFFVGFSLTGQDALPVPKLIVGVVVDQMRYDHLERYGSRFGPNGFNRILKEGYSFKNANYRYIPTFTAPGHASIYTGTSPSQHGIIGNSWYDRTERKVVESVDDSTSMPVGTSIPNAFGMSPKRLRAGTISDRLKASDNSAKIISISLKDRGAILPGGRSADAAYWHDWETSPGYFVSSSYYMDHLPDWVRRFNEEKRSDSYLNQIWEPLFPIETYTASAEDDNRYERAIGGKESPTFPYDFGFLREQFRKLNSEYQLLWLSPYGNNLLTEFAIQAIENESLGKDSVPDMLMLSYTVTDVIGHTLGQQSVEIEDVVLRLDRNIADLLGYLDQKVGKGNYVLFLTADHGAMLNGTKFRGRDIPSDVAPVGRYGVNLTGFLNQKYGAFGWIQHFENEQLYLNRQVISERKLSLDEIRDQAASFLRTQKGIADAVTSQDLQVSKYKTGLKNLVQNGFYPERSGDIVLIFEPGFVVDQRTNLHLEQVKGSTHGSGYEYDTHVPLLWFGPGINPGESVREVSGIDIAPTLALILNLKLHGEATGQTLWELFGKETK